MTKTLNQLNPFSGTIADDDEFLMGDTSALEDKRVAASDVRTYAQGSLANDIAERAVYVADYAALKAHDGTETVIVNDELKGGAFAWLSGDYSAQVAADTLEAIYVESSVTPATSGAWKRLDISKITPSMFSAAGDGATNDTASFTAIESMFPGETIDLAGKSYAVDEIPSGAVYINGNFVVSGNSREAWGASKINKVEIAGLSPERVSDTVLRIFPGYCADGNVDPTEIMELTSAYDIDRTTSGLGGVDNGVYEPNTNYFIYLLKNPDTGDVGAVLSKEISTSLVTKPAGYTLIRKLPWGYISIGGGIPSFHISYWPLPFTRYTDADESAQWRVVSGEDTTFTNVDLSGLIPDNARLAYIMVRGIRVSAAGKGYLRTTGAQPNGVPCCYVTDTVGDNAYNFLHIRTTSTRSLSYKVDPGVRLQIYVLGYSQTERS